MDVLFYGYRILPERVAEYMAAFMSYSRGVYIFFIQAVFSPHLLPGFSALSGNTVTMGRQSTICMPLQLFNLYSVGGKILGAVPILLLLYSLLTIALWPVISREYRHKQIS